MFVGCARKHEQGKKKGVIKQSFYKIGVFLVKKVVIYDITDSKIVRKIGKIVKSWSKKVIRNFGRENGNFFLKNVIQKSWSAKLFPVPQTRRQVSAYADGLII